jgi:hypothetical protein
MRVASCPRCGKPRPAFDVRSATVSCQRCRQTTQLTKSSEFLKKVDELSLEAEITMRSKRVADLIQQHDEYLKERGDYDIITATLDGNWNGEDDGFICDTE